MDASIAQILALETWLIAPKAWDQWIPSDLIDQFATRKVAWGHSPCSGWFCIEWSNDGKQLVHLEKELPTVTDPLQVKVDEKAFLAMLYRAKDIT